MNLPQTLILLTAKEVQEAPGAPEASSNWYLEIGALGLILVAIIIVAIARRLTRDDVLPPNPRVKSRARASEASESWPREGTSSNQEQKPNNIDSILGAPTPPPPGTPILTQVSATQSQPSRSSGGQGVRVLEEWTGDSALRGDFKDILGALGKKLDEALTQSKAHQELVDQLKSQNSKLAEEKAQLLDLLNNDKHRKLLLNLVAVIKLCNRSLPHVADNPKAAEFINHIREECSDRLNEAGLAKYSPEPGTPLTKLEGSLVERSPKTEPTSDAAKNDTVFQVIVPGYYHERDGKKSAVAKAEVIFYKHSSDSNPNPAA